MGMTRKSMPDKYLLIIDLCSLTLSFLLTAWIRFGTITNEWFSIRLYGEAYSAVILIYIAVYFFYDTSSGLFKRGFLDELFAVIKMNGLLAALFFAVVFIFQGGSHYSRLFFAMFFIINIFADYLARQYFKLILLGFYKKSNLSYKIMVMTSSDQAGKIIARMNSENNWEYEIRYLTIIDKSMIGERIGNIEVKADLGNMFDVAKKEVIDGVFIHIPGDWLTDINLEQIILEFQSMGIIVDLSINTFGLKIHEKVIRQMSGYHVMTFSSRLYSEGQLMLKRLMDIIGGLIGCIITLLLTIFIAPAIKLESPGPVFFSQIRIGKNGRRFKIYKFRSMYVDAEKRQVELMAQNEMNGLMFKMKDDPRVTKVGRFLRKTSLDEFPQFFNVLKGDMSLVGTRPPTEDEFIRYENRHKRRLAFKSGVTGLWQVSGRSDITDFEEVVKLDLDYIDNWSFKLDFKILLKTIGVVILGKGAR